MNSILKFSALIAGVLLIGGCSMGKMMVNERVSPYDFATTVQTIQDNASKTGWAIPKTYDWQKIVTQAGQHDPGKITVFKLCKANIAATLLKDDDNKFVSTMMPCSVSVYEKTDGKTYVAIMDLKLMGALMSKEVAEIMYDVNDQTREILNFLEE